MGIDLNVLSLRIFLSAVETGSLSKTARNLYISQPSVSGHIRSLERSLDAQILDRGPWGVRPTRSGRLLVERAKELMQTLASINDEIAASRGDLDRRLSVAGTTTLGSHLLPRVIGAFLDGAQDAQIEVVVGNSEAVLQSMIERRTGLGLTFGTVVDDDIEVIGMLSERLRLVAPANHPLSGKIVDPKELSRQRFLMREAGSSTRDSQEHALNVWGLSAARRCTIWSAEAAKEAVRAGLGVSVISEHVVARELREGSLAEIHTDPTPEPREVYLLSAKDFVHSPLERAFKKHLQELETWPS